MSFHFCADGVAVLGTVWILAAQLKRRSSAGACVDENCARGEECHLARWPPIAAAYCLRHHSFEPILEEIRPPALDESGGQMLQQRRDPATLRQHELSVAPANAEIEDVTLDVRLNVGVANSATCTRADVDRRPT